MKATLQFRLRTLFILTAVVAAGLGLLVRSQHLAAMARFHTQQQRIMEDRCLNLVLEDKNAQPQLHDPSDESQPGREMSPAKQAEASQYSALSKHHDEAALRYEIGSYLPFFPVSIPKPPETDAQVRPYMRETAMPAPGPPENR